MKKFILITEEVLYFCIYSFNSNIARGEGMTCLSKVIYGKHVVMHIDMEVHD